MRKILIAFKPVDIRAMSLKELKEIYFYRFMLMMIGPISLIVYSLFEKLIGNI
jgi:hypothetical protein